MIREFWVENYMSIAQRQCLNFISRGAESVLVSQIGGECLYKLGILFGPNASGKSNMLLALDQVFSVLAEPMRRSGDKVRNFRPFAFPSPQMSTLDFFNPFYHPKCPGDQKTHIGRHACRCGNG